MNTASALKIASTALALFSLAGIALADEISDAFDALKKAQEAKNAADVKKFAAETSRLARAEAAKPQPTDASQVDYWKQRVDYAKQTEVFTEYALAATAVLAFGVAAGPLGLGGWFAPYAWLAGVVPGFAQVRGPLRFGFLASFCLSVLAGFGVAFLMEILRRVLRPSSTRAAVAAVAAALCVAAVLQPLWSRRPPRPT